MHSILLEFSLECGSEIPGETMTGIHCSEVGEIITNRKDPCMYVAYSKVILGRIYKGCYSSNHTFELIARQSAIFRKVAWIRVHLYRDPRRSWEKKYRPHCGTMVGRDIFPSVAGFLRTKVPSTRNNVDRIHHQIQKTGTSGRRYN
jgi:hypothetical protein